MTRSYTMTAIRGPRDARSQGAPAFRDKAPS